MLSLIPEINDNPIRVPPEGDDQNGRMLAAQKLESIHAQLSQSLDQLKKAQKELEEVKKELESEITGESEERHE